MAGNFLEICFASIPCAFRQSHSDTRAASLASRVLHSSSGVGPALVIRCGDAFEARAAAAQICGHSARRPVLVQTDQVMGMAPWLVLNGLTPVFAQWLTPGERKTVPSHPRLPRFSLLLTGPEGEFESDDRTILDWRLETPSAN